MIKKLLVLVLLGALAFGIYYFVTMGNELCTVTLKSGEVKQMKAGELRSVYAKDSYNWGNYMGGHIQGTGKITRIEFGSENFRSGVEPNQLYYTVSIGSCMKLLVSADQIEGFAVGDRVNFEGVLSDGVRSWYLYVLGTQVETSLTLAPEETKA